MDTVESDITQLDAEVLVRVRTLSLVDYLASTQVEYAPDGFRAGECASSRSTAFRRIYSGTQAF